MALIAGRRYVDIGGQRDRTTGAAGATFISLKAEAGRIAAIAAIPADRNRTDARQIVGYCVNVPEAGRGQGMDDIRSRIAGLARITILANRETLDDADPGTPGIVPI